MGPQMFDLLFRVCALVPEEHVFTRLFLKICQLDTATSDVEGLGVIQRQIVTNAIAKAGAHLRQAVLTPLGRLGAKEIDLLHLLALRHVCKECVGRDPLRPCKRCSLCSQTLYVESAMPTPVQFHTHHFLEQGDPLLAPMARAEIFTNRLYRGLCAFTEKWTEQDWNELDASLFQFGPRFCKWCVAVVFDGLRIGRACGSPAINGGDTSYDLFRVQVLSCVLERGLRGAGKQADASRLQVALQTRGSTVERIRLLLRAVRDIEAMALHAAFCVPLFLHEGEKVSAFEVACKYACPPLQAVAKAFGYAFLHVLGTSSKTSFLGCVQFRGFDPPPMQRSAPISRVAKRSELVQRGASGLLKTEGPCTRCIDEVFQDALTLAAIDTYLGPYTAHNTALHDLTLAALASRMPWKALNTALLTTGPLFFFSRQGFRQTAIECCNVSSSCGVCEPSVRTSERAKRFLVHTANTLDAQNRSNGGAHSVEFVTRALNSLCMLGVVAYDQGNPSWEGIVDKFVQRKRKGEPLLQE